MEKNYKVKVNGEFEFDLTKKDVDALDILKTANGDYHLLDNHSSNQVSMQKTDFVQRAYHVKINHAIFEVEIRTPLDGLISSMGYVFGANKKVANIDAPMPGLILEVLVKVGQEVKENDPLLILEAMKMENVINSPRDGVIQSISVNQGDTVEKNHTLITFEEE
ncbi:Biotin carboxyl carrier protein of methylmalonyl-CoA decarboxylase [Croceitalea dokdonensis DOKDO 023]|uniref:Biotin carboxyl carrier protein of methylmalonyl-CoA decarboxylase n=1 Tax=Croceitalea dokdonensis DOKDO 023 TaxID=1300341 RepID=A0A0P7AUY6_9FLAO|nr:acetyl-CoA carboxylase biotin carboxyl carrier protein subunit [Croceitalea dokdonensis]KPM31669.1 Biotin carboxyl carrier protein of methylmalonyl-CoA decarboxylase [Croceitalea dokdonensis DOKDO 023]